MNDQKHTYGAIYKITTTTTKAIRMSWLRSSPLRQSFTRRTQDITQTGTDSKAVFDSFCKHWQQVNEIISRSEVRY